MRETTQDQNRATQTWGSNAPMLHRNPNSVHQAPKRRHAIVALLAALCASALTAHASAEPDDIFVSTYVHDSVTTFDGVEHSHPYGSFEQFIWAMSSALWTVDMWSGPASSPIWEHSFTIDYSDFGLPSFISFPYLDLNLDVKEPDTTQPITEFTVVNGAGVTIPLKFAAIVDGGRIECMIDRNAFWAQWDNEVTILFNQGPPPAQLIDITVAPPNVTLTTAAPSAALTVTGHFDDNSQQDLTPGIAGTSYASNDSLVVAVSTDGVIFAIWQGSTTVEASNSNITRFVNVTVQPGDYPVDGNDDGVIDEADLCIWLANPFDINQDGVINQVDWDILVSLLDEPFDDCNDNDIPDSCEIASGDSDDCNADGVPDECEADCNNNGVADSCDISGATSGDCNANGVPDDCEIAAGNELDVNGNGVPDSCEPDCNNNNIPDEWDINFGSSNDCDNDTVPDECGADCNNNGVADSCDINDGVSSDCNGNGVPDECDIAGGTSTDADINGIPDECEADCNNNGVPDAFDISSGFSADCNTNGVPDECEDDCNNNGVPDDCDITGGVSNDCNSNGIPDICDIAGGGNDANGNEIPDECELDCNSNGTPDDFDIFSGASADCDGNAVPDECDPDCNDNNVPDACEGVEELTSLFPKDGPPGSSDDRVALSGDIAVLGSYLDDTRGENAGAAYIFERDGSVWLPVAKVFATDGAAGDQFGRAIAVEDDVVVIGARLHDAGGTSAGAAYVFERLGGTWQQVAKLQPDDLAAGDRFGVSVGVSGSTIVIGASRNDQMALNAGAVYVYRRIGNQWSEHSSFFAADPAIDDYFGTSVAIDGGRIIIGARGRDSAGDESGAVYIFHPTVDSWAQQSKIVPPSLDNGDELGRSVAIEGDWAIMGAWRDDDAAPDAGAAYIYRFNGVNWNQSAKITASDGQALDGYGWAVDITDGTALVGAFGNDDMGNSAGSAYIYRFDGVNWNEELVAFAQTPEPNDNFGNSVAIDGPIALIGSPGGSAVNARMFSITTFADCNNNGVPDECDIANGDSIDVNANGVPDECEVKVGDGNGDGIIDVVDLLALLDAWGPCPGSCELPCAFDLTGPAGETDCVVDIFDLLELLANWGA